MHDLATLCGQVANFKGVVHDSRLAQTACIFVSTVMDAQISLGHIEQAIQNGASFVVYQHPKARNLSVPSLNVDRPAQALGLLASAWQKYPSDKMLVIGITGTCGKTSTAYFIAQLFKMRGMKVGLIGSIEVIINDISLPASHTTPNAVDLQDYLGQMYSAHCKVVVMEVSSHAIQQERIAGIAFDYLLFSNLSPEHLDYHHHMEAYYQCKKALFLKPLAYAKAHGKSPSCLINVSNDYGQRLFQELNTLYQAKFLIHPISPKHFLDETISNVQLSSGFSQFNLAKEQFRYPLIGRFNLDNVCLALALHRLEGASWQALASHAQYLEAPPGRMTYRHLKGRHIFIDFAHKPDALEKVIQALQSLKSKPQQLIVVFGCGGNRDKVKRPKMGAIAARLAEQVILSNDNPRFEEPKLIIQDILAGIEPQFLYKVSIEPERQLAIKLALSKAKPDDLVLIAGKGAETGQIVNGQILPFNDLDCLMAEIAHLT